jgi:inosine/xanthosine triphosphate pyrophosphatase family protein
MIRKTNNMKLVTPNINKIKEFRRILDDIGMNIPVVNVENIQEIQGTSEQMITYKALNAGKDNVVEDTTFIIDDEEIFDIKFKIQELKELKIRPRATWRTLVAVDTTERDDTIEVFVGEIHGIIIPDSTDEGYGFDPYFLPDGSDDTLAVLESEGKKDKFSARHKALRDFAHKAYYNQWKHYEIQKFIKSIIK